MAAQGELEPGQRVGAFEIATRIGRSAVGEVWIAHEKIGPGKTRRVALKRIHDPNPALRSSFSLAAEKARSIDHPGVARVLSVVDVRPGDPASVVELVEGMSAQDLLEAQAHLGRRLEPRLAVWVAREWTRTVVDLEAQVTASGFDHGYISPSNILLSRTGDVKLSDYFVARATRDPRIVGDLGHPPVSDVQGTVWTLASLLVQQDLSAMDDDERRRRLEDSQSTELARLLIDLVQGSPTLRELEDALTRTYFGLLGGGEASANPEIAAIVRALGDPNAPSSDRTIVEPPRMTAAFEERNQPVVPSPLTAQDVPAGFTRDVSVPPRHQSSADTVLDEESLRHQGDLIAPKLTGPKPQLPASSTSRAGVVSVTRTQEVPLSRKAAFAFLWFSAGVLAAAIAMYVIMR